MADFSTKNYNWNSTTVTLLGRKVTGIRGFEFNKEIEKEAVYAQGSEPIAISSGNKKYEGHIEILKHELDLLTDAAKAAGFEDIAEVPHESIAITCDFKNLPADKTRQVAAAGVAFTKIGIGAKQNDKSVVITLPFIAMKITQLTK